MIMGFSFMHRLVITELCNHSCPHCFNADMRMKGMMDADILIRYMRENTEFLKPLSVKHMGGEPTMHPRFPEMLKESVQHFKVAEVFTNGSKMIELLTDQDILRYHQTGLINFTVNGFTFDPGKFLEYRKYLNGMLLHNVVPLKGVDKFIERMISLAGLKDKINFIISPDTQINLFDDKLGDQYRASWMKALDALIPVFVQMGVNFAFDHSVPRCFFTDEMLKQLDPGFVQMIPHFTTCCSRFGVGLIQANFDVYFCNQTKIKIGSMLDDQGNPKSYPELLEMVSVAPSVKIKNMQIKSDKCSQCEWLITCRAGCYYDHL